SRWLSWHATAPALGAGRRGGRRGGRVASEAGGVHGRAPRHDGRAVRADYARERVHRAERETREGRSPGHPDGRPDLSGVEAMKEHGPLAGIPPEFAHEGHPVWDVIAPRDGVGGFTPAEFRYPWKMDARFLLLLYLMRLYAGVPFRISSDHRPPERNQAVGGASSSAHMEVPCTAVRSEERRVGK